MPYHHTFVRRIATACALSVAALIADAQPQATDAVFIMPSKCVYETCEDMWFKAYVLDMSTHRLSEKSNTLYLRITNPKDSVVWFEQYPLYAGRTEGQVYVGDSWQPGDYRIDGFTRSSLGDSTKVLMPRRIVVLDNLQKMDSVHLAHATDRFAAPIETTGNLRINIRLDSTEYHTKSLVQIDFEVTDGNGVPALSEMAVTVYDWLYHAPFAYDDIVAHYTAAGNNPQGNEFLPDGVAGKLRIGSKKRARELGGMPGEQYLNFYAPDGTANFIATAADGSFVIPRDALAELPRDFFIKPVSGHELKPEISIRNTNGEIEKFIEGKNVEWSHAIFDTHEQNSDTVPSYAGRRTYHLDDIEVSARVRYPKRDKFYGYLDSVSTTYGSAWVCRHAHGDEYLNDYRAGYTHHPNGYGMDIDGPVQVLRPVKGKSYKIVRYDTSEGKIIGNLIDLTTTEFRGERLSEEELLKLNGIWKAQGYYPHRTFMNPTREDVESGLFDNANTLLWHPSLLTDRNGMASVKFYTSDIATTFYIVVNAVDSYGNIGTATGTFNVMR